MASQSRRSAALLISVHVDPEGNPEWYAQISSYRNAFEAPISLATQTRVEGICDVIGDWLASVLKQEPPSREGSASA